MRTLAIDIGGTKFQMADFDGETPVRRESRATDRAGGRDWMLGQIRDLALAWHRDARFDRCGISFGGPVNFAAQIVTLSTHVGGWKDFRLTDWVRTELGLAAIMDNDANVGALGEALYGAGKGCGSVFYMTLSTGIGGGISKAGDKLCGPLRAQLRRQITGWSRARIDVAPAARPDDGVLYGALALTRELDKR